MLQIIHHVLKFIIVQHHYVMIGYFWFLILSCGIYRWPFTLQEMRTWGQSKISILLSLSSVWIKRIGRRGGFKILLCNPSGGNLLRQSIRVSHLEFRQTSTMELLCYNSQWAYHFDCFRKKASSQTSDLIPNAGPTKRCCKFEGVGAGRVGQQMHGIGGRGRIKL